MHCNNYHILLIKWLAFLSWIHSSQAGGASRTSADGASASVATVKGAVVSVDAANDVFVNGRIVLKGSSISLSTAASQNITHSSKNHPTTTQGFHSGASGASTGNTHSRATSVSQQYVVNSSALLSTGSRPISQSNVTPPYPMTHSQVLYPHPSHSSQFGSGNLSVRTSSPYHYSGSAISSPNPYSTRTNIQTSQPRSGGLPTNASVTLRSSGSTLSNSTRPALSSHTIGIGNDNGTGTSSFVPPSWTVGPQVLTSISSSSSVLTANTTGLKPSFTASNTKNATGTLEQSLRFSSTVATAVAASDPISNATASDGWSLSSVSLTTSSMFKSNSSTATAFSSMSSTNVRNTTSFNVGGSASSLTSIVETQTTISVVSTSLTTSLTPSVKSSIQTGLVGSEATAFGITSSAIESAVSIPPQASGSGNGSGGENEGDKDNGTPGGVVGVPIGGPNGNSGSGSGNTGSSAKVGADTGTDGNEDDPNQSLDQQSQSLMSQSQQSAQQSTLTTSEDSSQYSSTRPISSQPSASSSPSSTSRSSTPVTSVSSSSNAMSITSSQTITCSDCCSTYDYAPTETPDPADDDDIDEDNELPKRQLRSRFRDKRQTWSPRPRTNTFIKTTIGGCTVSSYTTKPNYPGPSRISSAEFAATPDTEMARFYATATYWAIPTNPPSCGPPGWRFMSTTETESLGYTFNQTGNKSVNIDHVYEASTLNEFFGAQITSMTQKKSKAAACAVISALFDVPDDATNGTRLNTLYAQLASYTNPDFLGMDRALNAYKGALWSEPLKEKSTSAPAYKQKLANIAVIMSMLNDPKVSSLFGQTNARIYQAFQAIDKTISQQDACISGAAGGSVTTSTVQASPTWAKTYQEWLVAKIGARNKVIRKRVETYTNALNVRAANAPSNLVGDEIITFLSTFNSTFPIDQMTFPIPTVWPTSAVDIRKRNVACQSSQASASTARLSSSVAIPFGNPASAIVTTPPSPSSIQPSLSQLLTSSTPAQCANSANDPPNCAQLPPSTSPVSQQGETSIPRIAQSVLPSTSATLSSSSASTSPKVTPTSSSVPIHDCSGDSSDCTSSPTTTPPPVTTPKCPNGAENYPDCDTGVFGKSETFNNAVIYDCSATGGSDCDSSPTPTSPISIPPTRSSPPPEVVTRPGIGKPPAEVSPVPAGSVPAPGVGKVPLEHLSLGSTPGNSPFPPADDSGGSFNSFPPSPDPESICLLNKLCNPFDNLAGGLGLSGGGGSPF